MVYPLIRQQALEEAAKVADSFAESSVFSDEEHYRREGAEYVADLIRDLKDKTDEAHNG